MHPSHIARDTNYSTSPHSEEHAWNHQTLQAAHTKRKHSDAGNSPAEVQDQYNPQQTVPRPQADRHSPLSNQVGSSVELDPAHRRMGMERRYRVL